MMVVLLSSQSLAPIFGSIDCKSGHTEWITISHCCFFIKVFNLAFPFDQVIR